MGTEAEIQDALELFGRTCFEVLKVEVSTYSVEEDPLRIEFCSNSGDLWYMLPLRETTIDPGYALLRMVAEAGYSLPSSQRMNLCHAGNDLHACLERLKAREAKADQTAAHVALGYTGLTFNNDQRSLSEAVRDAEAERLTVASAAHPGGVAAWSTGQSAVSAGGYLDAIYLATNEQQETVDDPGVTSEWLETFLGSALKPGEPATAWSHAKEPSGIVVYLPEDRAIRLPFSSLPSIGRKHLVTLLNDRLTLDDRLTLEGADVVYRRRDHILVRLYREQPLSRVAEWGAEWDAIKNVFPLAPPPKPVRAPESGRCNALPDSSLPWRVSNKAVAAGLITLDSGEWELIDDHWHPRERPPPQVERYPNPIDPYASHRHLQRMSERGPGIAATIRENHVKILRREMDRKLVVMATQDDTWGGENP